MTKITELGCAVMCNVTNTHTHTHTQWHRMTRMTGPDCVVMCNLINTHTHTHTHTHVRETGETWVESEKNVEKKRLVQ